ncbi:hypothetical protein GCM10017786_60550 [Amycolatopsis deserti]|uniref:DUF35 domain-containing protein n=1 Tax=Amycolatopsis deserti TaxID=185696 RepID=A0ABQ3JDG4_9PSEU|nr:OB-fold domain-containing protein [Amycolatopsis deserti]GHF18683.1 hypothetical protein GCM10017786_60550 [Amycolatopsis deserti]
MTDLIAGDWIARNGDTTALRISVCRDCSARWYPPREVCSTCASAELTQTVTGDRGVVYASTVVRVGAAGFDTPYVLSYVDIDGVRVLSHSEGEQALAPDTPVQLTVGAITSGKESHIVRPLIEVASR